MIISNYLGFRIFFIKKKKKLSVVIYFRNESIQCAIFHALNSGTVVDLEASEPISVVYSRRSAPNKRKDKGKAVAFPVNSTPILKISDSRYPFCFTQ